MTRIEAWTDTLDDEEYDHLLAALEQLEEHGPVTRRPFVDTLEGSKHANMKELRPRATSEGAHMRVLFAFDLKSRAVMLVAGNKAGQWKKWYADNIPIADAMFTEHQDRLRAKALDRPKSQREAPKRRKGK